MKVFRFQKRQFENFPCFAKFLELKNSSPFIFQAMNHFYELKQELSICILQPGKF